MFLVTHLQTTLKEVNLPLKEKKKHERCLQLKQYRGVCDDESTQRHKPKEEGCWNVRRNFNHRIWTTNLRVEQIPLPSDKSLKEYCIASFEKRYYTQTDTFQSLWNVLKAGLETSCAKHMRKTKNI